MPITAGGLLPRLREAGRRPVTLSSLPPHSLRWRPTPGPSRRAGGEHDGTFPNMSPASRTLVSYQRRWCATHGDNRPTAAPAPERGFAPQGVIPTIIGWNLCRSPPEVSSPACGGGWVGARFRASGSGGRSPVTLSSLPPHSLRWRPTPGPSRRAGGEYDGTFPKHESRIERVGITRRNYSFGAAISP